MLAARVEPKNGRQKSKKTGNFKPLVLVQFQPAVDTAQLMALRFFARANSFSRTPSAFAEFQATTRGTALQAIKALEDPFEVLVHAADSLGAEVQSVMHHALYDVLTTVAASEAHLHFSVCQDCAYLQNMLRLNKCDRVGPRVPTLQRSG